MVTVMVVLCGLCLVFVVGVGGGDLGFGGGGLWKT